MHKKHNKPHRHRDVSHKRSSKSRNHHKHHKKDKAVSQSLLEPILEVSKEKVKIDKNACGDYVQSSLLPQAEDAVKSISKHRREKSKRNKAEKQDEEEIDIFAKNYIQKIRDSAEQKTIVRHHSLEKSGESLIDKTRNLFRKEKSFNDAVQKVSGNVETQKDDKKERRKHRSRKDGKEHVKDSDKRREKRKHHDKELRHEANHGNEDKTEHKKKKRKKSKNKSDKSPKEEKVICNRVQEVIYCHLDQIPYKMKNDKSATEVKDLYQRTKKEKRIHKEVDRKERSRSHGDEKKRYHLEKDRSHQSHHSPIVAMMSVEEKVKKERSKSRKKEQEEILAKEKKGIEKREKGDHSSRDRYRHYDLEGIFEHSPRKCKSGTVSKRKYKKESVTKIDLGAYDKYFLFENKKFEEICPKKHKNHEERRKSSKDKHRQDQKEVADGLCKKHHKRNHSETDSKSKKTLEADEEKIHQIIDGDFQDYFAKIQHMIDVKLDALVKAKKSHHEKINRKNNKEEEPQKRSKSKPREKEPERKERGDCKKEDKSEKLDKTTHDKHDKIRKEEIVEEVLKRIKDEEEQKKLRESTKRSADKENKTKVKDDKESEVRHANRKEKDSHRHADNINAKELKNQIQPPSKKVQETVLRQRSFSKDNYESNDRNRKTSSKKHYGNSKSHKQARLESKDHSSDVHSLDKEHYKQRHQENQDKKNTFNDDETSLRRSRSPVYIPSSRRSSERKQRSTESRLQPRDSLAHHKRHCGLRPAQVEPPPEMSIFDWEERTRTKRRFRGPHTHVYPGKDESSSYHSLRKHYTSASSCRAYSEHHIILSGVTPEKSERGNDSKYEYKQIVSDQMYTNGFNDRRRSSSPNRCIRPLENMRSHDHGTHDRMPLRSPEIYPRKKDVLIPHQEEFLMARQGFQLPNVSPEDNYSRRKSTRHGLVESSSKRDVVALEDIIGTQIRQNNRDPRPREIKPPRSGEIYPQRENLVVSRPEDLLVAHQDFEITKLLREDHYFAEKSMNHGLEKIISKHDVVTQNSYLEGIILPPEMFRNPPTSDLCEITGKPEKQYPKQDFLVQGIEPPILDPPRKTSKAQVRQRNLECKTVSIIGILPQKIGADNARAIDDKQASCNSQKSISPDRDLVEKRKQSKRFKLYYKYSLIDNDKEDKESGTSDARSIVSDSYRVFSEPSEDEKAPVQCHSDVKDKERHISLELQRVSQALDISLPTSSRLVAQGVQKDYTFSAQESLAKVACRGRPIHKVHENVIRSRTYMMYSEGLHVTLCTLNEQLGELDEVKMFILIKKHIDVRSALL